jgi:hypothetical protein
MSSSQFSLSARVSSSYSELSSVATELNAISDALGKAVSDIDEGLKKLNLGVTAWVRVDSAYRNSPQDGCYEIEEIGYAKISGKWGIALRTRRGDDNYRNDAEGIEEWLFNDAPRASRVMAIEKIPELLNKLNEEAAKVTKELQAKLADAEAVASAVRLRPAKPLTDAQLASALRLRPATPKPLAEAQAASGVGLRPATGRPLAEAQAASGVRLRPATGRPLAKGVMVPAPGFDPEGKR